MTTVEEYLQFARECTRWASECDNETDQQAFLQLAKDWTEAAMRARALEGGNLGIQAVADERAPKPPPAPPSGRSSA